MKKIAIYPGSFDPFTNGHYDILRRALKVFDEIIVLVAIQPNKVAYFSIEERVDMIKEAISDLPGVSVDSSTGLSVEYALKHQAIAIIRGLRAAGDFEYEFKLAAGNRFLHEEIDMVLFMADPQFTFLSSSTVKELALNDVDVSPLVPPSVTKAFRKKLKKAE